MQLSFLSCFPANLPASFLATTSADIPAVVWPPACLAWVSGSVPLQHYRLDWGEWPATKPGSVAGSVRLDDSKPTWNTIGEIMEPNKITFNLKINTEKLSSTLAELSKKFATEMANAADKAMLAFSNLGESMAAVPVGVLRSGPISFPVTFDRSKPIVASGQVAYAPVIYETFSKLRLDDIADELLKRYR